MVLKRYSEDAVRTSLSMIVEDRRSKRKDEVPVVFSKPKFDDDIELEWFEKPLASNENGT